MTRELSKVITTTIGEARIPTLPALFKLYINEVTDYIIHRDGEGINILNTSVQILLYADDIDLVSKSHASLQHLNALDSFCRKKRLMT